MLQSRAPIVDVNKKKEAITLLAQFTENLSHLRALREAQTEGNLLMVLQDGQAKANVKRAAVRSFLIIYSAAIIFGIEG